MNLKGENMLEIGEDELLEAQSHIENQIFKFLHPMCLSCAIQLGIPDAIHSHAPNPMPLSLLISSLQLHPTKTEFIYRLMRLLTHSGFFVVQKQDEEEEGYMLTNSSRFLLKDNPFNESSFLVSMPKLVLGEPWKFLSEWVHSNDPRTPFETLHGMSFWEYMRNKHEYGEIFNAGMANDARLVKSVLLGKHKGIFEGIGSLVDVGGGTGTMAKAIAKAFPQIQCNVLDLPQVVANLKSNQPNFKYVEGDMFNAIPTADALLLKWILHNWSDEECVKILKKCKEAITSNGNKGKVMVIDIVLLNTKNEDSIETQLFFDMMMMILFGGKEREEKEWAHLVKEAGFSSYKIFPILGIRSLIEIYP